MIFAPQYKVPNPKMLKEGFLFTFISAFMALFPVANPVGAGFLVNGLLSGLDDEDRKSIIRRIITDYLLVGLGVGVLAVMFTAEAVFGPAGLVAAPLLYAYLKKELSAAGLV